MEIEVNGHAREVSSGMTIAQLVDELGYGAKQVVVEHNGDPVERERFADVTIEDGDVIEVVRAVAGGCAGGCGGW